MHGHTSSRMSARTYPHGHGYAGQAAGGLTHTGTWRGSMRAERGEGTAAPDWGPTTPLQRARHARQRTCTLAGAHARTNIRADGCTLTHPCTPGRCPHGSVATGAWSRAHATCRTHTMDLQRRWPSCPHGPRWRHGAGSDPGPVPTRRAAPRFETPVRTRGRTHSTTNFTLRPYNKGFSVL